MVQPPLLFDVTASLLDSSVMLPETFVITALIGALLSELPDVI